MPHDDKELTTARADAEFRVAFAAKRKLIERQREDFLFALGKQWTDEEVADLKKAGVEPTTDNRIAPNIFLLTGLERQNRTDFRAFPEGEEDSLKANIASILLRHIVKRSGFNFEASDQFKDGITSGESHLELYLDFTESLINGEAKWAKCDGDSLFPDPTWRKYDFSDAKYIYKIRYDVSKEDLINLFPEKKTAIEEAGSGRLDKQSLNLERGGSDVHLQRRDYPKAGEGESTEKAEDQDEGFDLIERYYKKWVDKVFLGDKQTGVIKPVTNKATAQQFIDEYQQEIQSDAQAFLEAKDRFELDAQSDAQAFLQAQAQFETQPAGGVASPPIPPQPKDAPVPPPDRDPERFRIIEKQIPEIWVFSYVPGIEKELDNSRAWFYPKWKTYPFIPFFARFSTAPIQGEDRHLLVQGLVHGVKGAQRKHNRAETLMLRHLSTSTNSGWLVEADSWVDPAKVDQFGTSAGVNLEYKRGRQKPERITPMPLSQAHAAISSESAESIKAQLGINSDLLAVQDNDRASGRAIALRQRQGLLMVQEPFDNFARTKQIAGRFLLSQLGEMYDVETAIHVLGETFLAKNFPPPTKANEETGEPEPLKDEVGAPMRFDRETAQIVLAEIFSGELEKYDVAIGEVASSESQRIADATEVRELAEKLPGLIPPNILIQNSQLPESVKTEILSAMEQAQAQAAAEIRAKAQAGKPQPAKSGSASQKET